MVDILNYKIYTSKKLDKNLVNQINFFENKEVPKLSVTGGDLIKNFGIDQKNFEDQLENMATDAEIYGAPGLNPRVPSVKEMINLYEEAWRAF